MLHLSIFCDEVNFQHHWPFDPTELFKFRHRMGEKGMERILKVSIDLFERKEIQEKRILVDTTVQEKNLTYPTDTKLQKKIIEKCRVIAKEEGKYEQDLLLFHRILGSI